MPTATTDLRPEETAPVESFLPALLRTPKQEPRPVADAPGAPDETGRSGLVRIGAVLLVAPCVYFGVRLMEVDGPTDLPPGLAADGTSAVVVPKKSPFAGDARELRSLRAAAAAATAAPAAASAADSKERRHGKRRDGEQGPPGGGSSGGERDDGTLNVTLPIIGETPIPDPGVEVPSLPIDPGAAPTPEELLPEAGAALPDPVVPLP
jgi:hypothetical protein